MGQLISIQQCVGRGKTCELYTMSDEGMKVVFGFVKISMSVIGWSMEQLDFSPHDGYEVDVIPALVLTVN